MLTVGSITLPSTASVYASSIDTSTQEIALPENTEEGVGVTKNEADQIILDGIDKAVGESIYFSEETQTFFIAEVSAK